MRAPLLAMLAGLTLALAACDDDKGALPPPPPMTGRANAVTARETAAPPPTQAPQAASGVTAHAERKLCQGQATRSAPTGKLKTASAPGVDPPPSTLPVGVGKWVWINLWAAWCAPCKEEIPRILSWQEKLRAAGVSIDVAFVSFDDDERETKRFLEGQPANGLRATYWLPEADRSAWLGPLGLKGATSLPVQAFVAPSGDVSCVVQGAIEDHDYAALASFLGAKSVSGKP